MKTHNGRGLALCLDTMTQEVQSTATFFYINVAWVVQDLEGAGARADAESKVICD